MFFSVHMLLFFCVRFGQKIFKIGLAFLNKDILEVWTDSLVQTWILLFI